jgi:hypothetical protein
MVRRVHLFMYVTALTSLLVFPPKGTAGPINFVGSGADATALLSTVNAYRAALGDPNNANAPGPLASGRREINWDGGGSATTISADPLLAFLNIRGAQFDTPGTGFIQAPLDGFVTTFGQPGYATEFETFSPLRLFSPIGSNITDVTFSIPGTGGAVAATVGGFGVVFTDVDLADSTQLLFFGIFGELLFSDFVSPGTVADGSLSFLGAIGDAGERIARVRIVSGNVAPGPDDNPTAGADVALMDDVLYREPQAVPEPSLAVLLTLGATAVMLRRKLGV